MGDHSQTYLFNGYSDGGYPMAIKTAIVLSSVHAICLPMPSTMGSMYYCTSTITANGPETSVKPCQREYHGM